MKIKKELWFNYLVYLSFIPLLIKGITYLRIQLFYPFMVSFLILGSMLFLLKLKRDNAIKTIKYWGILIMLYAITRLVLFGLIQIADRAVPSVVFYQFNFWYHFKTLLFLILGYLCFSKRKYYVIE